ncbi:MAG: DNA polymerase Y family protein [Rhodospirillales bacterium]|nr:DNA polymerase Y family protein [Rhodospirillales bacterium]MBO6787016.1 DNA polymerase Y family protein [Rhodospirillales bacterium]
MNRRYISVWLKHWAGERRRVEGRRLAGPLALVQSVSGGVRVCAVDTQAASDGIVPGMTLADARALLPGIRVAAADPEGDTRALAGLVDWCGRYTPFTAADGLDGIILDITGCAHLFGGEDSMLGDLTRRLRRMELTVGVAAADTPGAAWAWARFGRGNAVPIGRTRDWFSDLPVAALRLPSDIVEKLREYGLGRIGDLYRIPRAPLVKRCGMPVLNRLDQVFGHAAEPISPVRPAPEWRSRIVFPEPIGRAEDIAEATRRLLQELCAELEKGGRGARQLALVFYRVDGQTQRIGIGTGRAGRDPAHLMKLFREKLAKAEPGFGIEQMSLEAVSTDRVRPGQIDLAAAGEAGAALDPLIDRLQNRLGGNGVYRIAPVESHIPERAVTVCPATDGFERNDWIADQPRPVRLLAAPEPIDAVTPEPGRPPVRFVWRRQTHRVCLADGPERIAPEWWRRGAGRRFRDYYRLEDEEGRRFWVFRDGTYAADVSADWYMHGLFA